MPEEEEWRDAKDYEGIYQVSNMGRVRRVARGPSTRPGYILSPDQNRSGYLRVHPYRNGKAKSCFVHRLVCWAFNGPPPTMGHQINHKNGIKNDNRVSNLEWVTRDENVLHAYRILGIKTGRVMRGEANPASKLTNDQVKQIRELWATGHYTLVKLGSLFGVSQSMIHLIVNRKRWRHI